ncbi:acetylserotonin O-methyltransferase-like [Tripterygium wilfordii]|uniref:acetylserotonin O-methyltransferase-like n=1 Tax=Tripterygium wilfordii TaxID=458696 RepID=UPI0018F84ABC|nr:acetylserotonin O-methyltransferase-like [Tripterygium wilfordii]
MGENKLDTNKTVKGEEEIWRYVFGFVNMAAAKCAIELGIADVIENHKTPITGSDLASIIGCEPSFLHRIMRFLVHERVFKEEPTSQGTMGYVQTPLSRRLLSRGGENSLADLLLLESSPVMLAPWHHLSTRIRAISATTAFEGAHGKDVWAYAEADSAYSKLINDAMACNAIIVVPAILEGCGEVFDGVSSLVDVGGGNGTTLSMLVKSCPWMTGINFDLPHVVSAATECSGVQHVAGDMFDNIPKADAVFIKWVLHDWGDDECIQILKNCREAVPSDKGKVIIVEAVIKEEGGDKLEGARLMLDMAMMAHTTQGKERTLKEWDYVLKEAGFSKYNINPIRALQSVIEAFP